jgi:hypothetical protein
MESPDIYTQIFLLLVAYTTLSGVLIAGELVRRLYRHIVYTRPLRKRLSKLTNHKRKTS